jgi:protein-S-isoprenylcysteine O-methyltransferase Ste14
MWWNKLSEQLSRWGFQWVGWIDNRRGEWWLATQLLLLFALLLPPVPPPLSLGVAWPLALRLLGAALLALALVLAAQALWRLGPSLTPLPEPMPDAALVTEGPYGRCRHPLYQAILIGALGMTLLLGSLLHLALLLGLALVLGGKARREERSLLLLHPEYSAYRALTPAILPRLPWLDWR